MEGLIGQNGSESAVEYAAHAIATHNPSCTHPSAVFAFDTPRASAAPRLLPMPRPTRKTARISENVYAVAPNSSDNTRVHTTSDPSAVNPDNAIAMYTSRVPSADIGCGAGSDESDVITV